MSTYHKINELN